MPIHPAAYMRQAFRAKHGDFRKLVDTTIRAAEGSFETYCIVRGASNYPVDESAKVIVELETQLGYEVSYDEDSGLRISWSNPE